MKVFKHGLGLWNNGAAYVGNMVGSSVLKFFLSPLGAIVSFWIAAISIAFYFGIVIIIAISSSGQSNESDISVGGGLLSEETLAWSSDVRRELEIQGVALDWQMYVLGIIQAESGGDATKTPDIMQASESLGQGMNTITDPIKSIAAGIQALSHSIARAKVLGIEDKKAILQAYNFGTYYLDAMAKEGLKTFDINFSQEYSRTVVYPAVTGKSASSALKSDYVNPWSTAVGMPWYWKNGGNFHYPNIIEYYTSFGSTGIFASPFEIGTFVVTSEFEMRIHPVTGVKKMHAGIDLVSNAGSGAPIHSISDGKVIVNDFNAGGWGNYIVIDHGKIGKNEMNIDPNKNVWSLYGHLKTKSPKAVGQSIKSGEVVASMGTTGSSTGDHLHLEIRVNDQSAGWSNANSVMNPRLLINFK